MSFNHQTGDNHTHGDHGHGHHHGHHGHHCDHCSGLEMCTLQSLGNVDTAAPSEDQVLIFDAANAVWTNKTGQHAVSGNLDEYTLNYVDGDGAIAFSIDISELPTTLCLDQDFIDCLVAETKLKVGISTDLGQVLTEGTDGKVYLDCPAIKACETITTLVPDFVGDTLTYTDEVGAATVIDMSLFLDENLYNTDGILTGARVVDMGGNNITWQNGGEFIIDGKLTVTGLIDPTGLQFTGPEVDGTMPVNTIFVTDGSASTLPSGELVFKDGGGIYHKLEHYDTYLTSATYANYNMDFYSNISGFIPEFSLDLSSIPAELCADATFITCINAALEPMRLSLDAANMLELDLAGGIILDCPTVKTCIDATYVNSVVDFTPLQIQITDNDNDIANLQIDVGQNTLDIAQEILDRIAGDTLNAADIAQEALDRIAGDAANTADIVQEALDRIAGDAANTADIVQETADRIAGDVALQTQITANDVDIANLQGDVVVDAANIGTGSDVFDVKVGNILNFRSIKGINDVTTTVVGNEVHVDFTETITSIVGNNASHSITFTDEAGNSTLIDVAALVNDFNVSGGSLVGGILTLTDTVGSTPDIIIDMNQFYGSFSYAAGVHTYAAGDGSTYNIDVNASALPFDDTAVSFAATNVQIALEQLDDCCVQNGADIAQEALDRIAGDAANTADIVQETADRIAGDAANTLLISDSITDGISIANGQDIFESKVGQTLQFKGVAIAGDGLDIISDATDVIISLDFLEIINVLENDPAFNTFLTNKILSVFQQTPAGLVIADGVDGVGNPTFTPCP